MDFLKVDVEPVSTGNRNNQFRVKPDFVYGRSKDLITKGGAFYGFWDGEKWSQSLEYLCKLIDDEIFRVGRKFEEEWKKKHEDTPVTILYSLISSASSKKMALFVEYCKYSRLEDIELNTRVKFKSDVITREDYSTIKVDYDPIEGESPAFDKLINTLYEPSERQKIMWFVGAALTGSMGNIQKMLYLYGGKGTGKSTIIDVIAHLFGGYVSTINLKMLTSNDPFATSGVINTPLLIDHDTDLKSIKNDTNLLKLISHETIQVNQKYKEQYYVSFEGLLISASNQRFGVRNIESGITRRVVVVRPSGILLERDDYDRAINDVKYESAAIAFKCMQLFKRLGHKFYDKELDVDIVEDADIVFRFVRTYYSELISPDGILLSRAHKLFVQFLEEDFGKDVDGSKSMLREGLKLYFKKYSERKKIGEHNFRNWYGEIDETKVFPERYSGTSISAEQINEEVVDNMLGMKEGVVSELDKHMADYQAQYALPNGNPEKKWDSVLTTLKEIDTSRLHWVKVPLNHIVIDFDLKDESGNKSLDLNVKAASEFPSTYTEVSKSGQGVHLHYIYDGNIYDLAREVKPGIEIKTFTGNASLRRKHTMSNGKEIRHISSGLPFKEIKETEMYDKTKDIIWNEKTLRKFILNAIANKHHPNTRPEILYIISEMSKAKDQGLKYDLTDLRETVRQKAMLSTNHGPELLKLVETEITWDTIKEDEELLSEMTGQVKIVPNEEIVFYDIEVYQNLFVVVWKKWHDDEIIKWVNPTPDQIEYLLSFPLVGFNNRRYDNHIIYARTLGASLMDMYIQSGRIVNDKNSQAGFYSAAYELSYADIYEYVRDKKSLKKWQVELGLSHVEMEIPWDQPVPEDLWDTVVEYCVNDVITTEALFDHTYSDYVAREVLATLCGGSMNATNNGLTTRFIFGDDPNPVSKLIYTNLSETFPGYIYSYGKSEYRGENPSEGGYVYTEPGVYKNVSLNDVTSMHPNSAINLNYFGIYTERYKTLLDARVWIKHKDFDKILENFPQLKPYLKDEYLKTMDVALKVPINSIYGLSSAKFDNKCRHPKNDDNIIAKRGALFMIDLKHAVQDEGYKVVHIKTDSIKVADADDKVNKFIEDFAKQPKYNYNMEHEAQYSRFALIDKAQYICQDVETGEWSATGAQFQDPYTFKRIWSKDNLVDDDFHIIKSTNKGHLFLDNMFVGKVGKFYASKSGYELRYSEDKENFKYLSGTKGYKFKLVDDFDIKDVDMDYYQALTIDGLIKIMKVGQLRDIVDDIPDDIKDDIELWYETNQTRKIINDNVRDNFIDGQLKVS